MKDPTIYQYETVDEQLQAMGPMPGAVVEVIGSWVWVYGDTKDYYKTLRSLDFRYSKSRKAYFWTPVCKRTEAAKKKATPIPEARKRYGSRRVGNN